MSAEHLARLLDQLGFKRPSEEMKVTIEEIEITKSGEHTYVKRTVKKSGVIPSWASKSISEIRKMLAEFHRMLEDFFP